jgi:hypothetical protein
MEKTYHSAEWDYVVDDNFVQQTCPEEWKCLSDFLEDKGLSIYLFAEIMEYEEGECKDITDEEYSEAMMLYDELVRQFKMKTGFTITLRYHDIDEYGTEIQTIEGCFFTVDYTEVIRINPLVKKIGMDIKFHSWISDADYKMGRM